MGSIHRAVRFLCGVLLLVTIVLVWTAPIPNPEARSDFSVEQKRAVDGERHDATFVAILFIISAIIEGGIIVVTSENWTGTFLIGGLTIAEICKVLLVWTYVWYLDSAGKPGPLVQRVWNAVAFVCFLDTTGKTGPILQNVWESFAWIAFFAAVIVLFACFIATNYARPELSRRNLSRVLFSVLAAFLHVITFMTLAVAIHNKNSNEKALYRAQPPASFAGQDMIEEEQSPPEVDRVRKFFFNESDEELACTKVMKSKLEAEPKLVSKFLQNDKNDDRMAVLAPLSKLVKSYACQQRYDLAVAAWNVHEVLDLEQIFTEVRKSGRAVKYTVDIYGHANDKPIVGQRFANNIQISEMRARSVRHLLDELKRRTRPPPPSGAQHQAFNKLGQIEDAYFSFVFPDPIGKGNENAFLDQEGVHWDLPSGLFKKLSVEVRFLKMRNPSAEMSQRADTRAPLTLLDYTYFMIYTMTTTGYGDLVPVDSEVKFFTSVANLAEFFFIVIVINSLVASRSRS